MSVNGCSGSGQATRHLDKYDSAPYTDQRTVTFAQDVVYKAAVRSLQQRGYFVSLSDPQTGLLNAEINSPEPIPEEQKALQEGSKSESTGIGTILLAILGVVLLFGLIASLDGCSDSKKETKTRSEHPDNHGVYIPSPGEKSVTSYKYVVTLTMTAVNQFSTQIQVSAVRMVVENGSVTNSARMENKYLNYGILDTLEEQLAQ